MPNFKFESTEGYTEYVYNLQSHALIINERKDTVKSIPTKLYATLLDNHIELVNKYRNLIEVNEITDTVIN